MRVECLQSEVDFYFLILCIYIPLGLIRQAVESLEELLDFVYLNFPKSAVVVTGDFNFPDIDWVDCVVKPGSGKKSLCIRHL